MLIGVRILQDAGQQEKAHLAVHLRVEVLGIGTQPLADEYFQSEVWSRRWSQAGFTGHAGEFGHEGWEQDRAAGLQQGLLEDTLQLPDVARSGVGPQTLQRFGGDLLYLPPQVLAEAGAGSGAHFA